VIEAARAATCQPAVALLTAFPIADEDWQEMGADKMLVKPMHTRLLLQQIEKLLDSRENRLTKANGSLKSSIRKAPAKKAAARPLAKSPAKKAAKKASVRK